MRPVVKIVAFCRKPELFHATTLVFNTIRVGFPTADIEVYGNGLTAEQAERVASFCRYNINAKFSNGAVALPHHHFIKQFLLTEHRPFVLCDTDMLFWSNVENWKFDDSLMAGRFIPAFFDPFTEAHTYQRLHTSLLWFPNPKAIRERLQCHVLHQSAEVVPPSFVEPMLFYTNGVRFLHDTCSSLYHALGGRAFTFDQLDCYDHLNCGTILDLVDPSIPGHALSNTHRLAQESPQQLKGLWRSQTLFYNQHTTDRII